MTDERPLLARLRDVDRADDYARIEAADEIERLRMALLDACRVFEHYDLPEHAFHYRREILGLDQAKKMARVDGQQEDANG